MLRRRQLPDNDDGCVNIKAVNTTFNGNEDAYLFAGIMFSIRTNDKPITIQTMELDVRLDQAGNDLAVEVYTIQSGYTTVVTNPFAWQQVADAKAVPVPGGGGVLIPTNDFAKVHVPANTLQSFYVTMPDRYLDSRANGLHRSGELDQQFDDFRIDVGSGLSSKFPFLGGIDKTVAPKFAAVIHYSDDSSSHDSCLSPSSTGPVQTEIAYDFLVDANKFDDSISASMSNAVTDFLSKEEKDGELSGNTGILAIDSSTSKQSSRPDSDCDEAFSECLAVRTFLHLDHMSSVGADVLRYKMYSLADTLMLHVQKALSDKKMTYNGMMGASSLFQITLVGVPANTKMNLVQTKYVQDSMKVFLSSFMDQDVYQVNIKEQSVTQRRSMQFGVVSSSASLTLTGEINGAQHVYFPYQKFAEQIENTLQSGKEIFLEGLSFNVLRPSANPMGTDDANFFRAISDMYSSFDAVPHTLPPQMFQTTFAPTPTLVPDEGLSDAIQTTRGKVSDGASKLKDKAKEAGAKKVGIACAVAITILALFLVICRMRSRNRMRWKEPKRQEAKRADSESARKRTCSVSSEEKSGFGSVRTRDTVSIGRSQSFDGSEQACRSKSSSASSEEKSGSESVRTRDTVSIGRSQSFDDSEQACRSKPTLKRLESPQRGKSADELPAKPPNPTRPEDTVAPKFSQVSRGPPERVIPMGASTAPTRAVAAHTSSVSAARAPVRALSSEHPSQPSQTPQKSSPSRTLSADAAPQLPFSTQKPHPTIISKKPQGARQMMMGSKHPHAMARSVSPERFRTATRSISPDRRATSPVRNISVAPRVVSPERFRTTTRPISPDSRAVSPVRNISMAPRVAPSAAASPRRPLSPVRSISATPRVAPGTAASPRRPVSPVRSMSAAPRAAPSGTVASPRRPISPVRSMSAAPRVAPSGTVASPRRPVSPERSISPAQRLPPSGTVASPRRPVSPLRSISAAPQAPPSGTVASPRRPASPLRSISAAPQAASSTMASSRRNQTRHPKTPSLCASSPQRSGRGIIEGKRRKSPRRKQSASAITSRDCPSSVSRVSTEPRDTKPQMSSKG